jgi:multiple sugar transport system substrate-binding protein
MRWRRLVNRTRAWSAAAAVAFAAVGLAIVYTAPPSLGATETVIRFVNWESSDHTEKPWVDDIEAKFMKDNPGVRIQDEPADFSGHLHELVTQCAAGNCPDVAEAQGNDIASLASAKLLQSLDTYDNAFFNSLQPSTVARVRFNGVRYGMPWAFDPIGWVYNKDLMKRVGLDPNTPPKTIAEAMRDIATAKQYDPNLIGLGIDTTLRDFGLDAEWPYMHAFGAEPIKAGKPNADTPQMRAYLEWVRTLIKNRDTLPGKKMGEFRIFSAQGHLLFLEDGPYFKSVVQGQNKDLTDDKLYATYGVAPIPGGPANGPSAGSSDHQVVVFASSKNQAMAIKFMRYLTADEYAMRTFTIRNGDLPAVQGMESKIPQLNNPITLGFIRIGSLVVTPPYGPKYEEAYPPIMSNVQRTYSTTDPIADIARSMQAGLLQVYGK